MAQRSNLVTEELLAGLYGSEASIQIRFDIWLDSGHGASSDPAMAVVLTTGAPISDLLFDASVLAAKPGPDATLSGRQVTFTQVNPAKSPRWTTVFATLAGSGPWTVAEDRPAIFELTASGSQLIYPYVVSTYSGARPLQASGGVYPKDASTPYVFPRNGGMLITINSGNSIYHEVRWNTVRLSLHDPKDKLTNASLRAALYSSDPGSGAHYGESGAVSGITRLGPVTNGYRFVDFTFNKPGGSPYGGGIGEFHVVMIEAPILQYLLAYKAESKKFHGSSTFSDVYAIEYNPSRSYTSGYQGQTTSFEHDGIATEMLIWHGIEHSMSQDSKPEYIDTRFDFAWGVPDVSDPLPGAPTSDDHTYGSAFSIPTSLDQSQHVLLTLSAPRINVTQFEVDFTISLSIPTGTAIRVYLCHRDAPDGLQLTGSYVDILHGSTGATLVFSHASNAFYLDDHVASNYYLRAQSGFINGAHFSSSLSVGSAVRTKGYSHFPHAVRNVDITLTPSPSLGVLGHTKRGHFS
jgi:hypothetical protein